MEYADVEPLLPNEVILGVGLDVMDIREDSERLLGGAVEIDEVETREEFPKARTVSMYAKMNAKKTYTSAPMLRNYKLAAPVSQGKTLLS